MTDITLGLEHFLAAPPPHLKGLRFGLLCNAASVDRRFRHARHLLHDCLGQRLTSLFSPQHGLFGDKQDNMIESGHRREPGLNIPVFSLYSETRIPTKEMFDHLDALLVDLPDVGTRVYTFMYTVSYCMEAARKLGKKVIILDRPNPIGGLKVEGNILNTAWSSFVGRFPIPMRHGLTMGELALMFNKQFGIGCDLEVIALKGWRREMLYSHTGLPWVAPSPNLPTPTSALVYPGQVIWEGTNVSEARGTTQPFEMFGAPYIDTGQLLNALGGHRLPGAVLRPVEFEPTSNKWQSQRCCGFQIHVVDPDLFQPYLTSLALLQAILKCHRREFQWKSPPYEYEYDRLPNDLILGDQQIRLRLEKMEPVDALAASWREELESYDQMRSQYFLYR